jgi:hypothetical protein
MLDTTGLQPYILAHTVSGVGLTLGVVAHAHLFRAFKLLPMWHCYFWLWVWEEINRSFGRSFGGHFSCDAALAKGGHRNATHNSSLSERLSGAVRQSEF